MADANKAIDFVLRQEDSDLAGSITDTPGDRGGTTRFGLTRRWHPELVASGFFDSTVVDGKRTPKLATTEALSMAERTYASVYGPQLALDRITNQIVATALLSFAVLEGTQEAVALLQRSLVANGATIAVDGIIGSATITALNAADPVKLIGLMVALQKRYFVQLARNIPSQTKWVAGWDNRANAILALATPSRGDAKAVVVADTPSSVPAKQVETAS